MSESDSQTKAELQSEFKVPSAALGRRKKQEGIQKARERGEEHPVVTEQEHHVETTEAKEVAAPDKGTTLEQTQERRHVQKLKDATSPSPAVPYNEPQWSGLPVEPHTLTVIKNGTVVQEVDVSTKAFHVFGRLPTCDVPLEHPSISRHHAILQYRPHSGETPPHAGAHHTPFSTNPQESGFYIYDLGSTHGTFLNKTKVQPRCYYRMRVGQMVRFGGSSRLFVLEGGGGQEGVEQEAEAERHDILRQKEQFERRKAEHLAEEERAARERAEMGATWGIVMDDIPLHAQESEEIEIDPAREAYYKEDPKKALRKFFDREGLELEYETEEEGPLHSRTYTVKVRSAAALGLPIDMATGEPLYAEASVRGRKKEAVLQCALNACRILDTQGMLRNPIQARKRKLKSWEENDYYDSDDDTFLDRTGSVEKKREKRMKKAGKVEEVPESYKSLQAILSEVQAEIHSLENRLARANQVECTEATVDSLDAYMKSVGDQLDETKKLEIKHSLHDLKKEEERVRKLIEITKPVDLPGLSSTSRRSPQHQYSQESPVVTSQEKKENESKRQKHRQRSSKKLESQLNPPNVNVGCSSVCESKPHMKDTTPNEECAVVPTLDRGKPSATLPSQKKAKTMQWEDDDNYSSWIPPSNQSGDGRTHLNEKFGY